MSETEQDTCQVPLPILGALTSRHARSPTSQFSYQQFVARVRTVASRIANVTTHCRRPCVMRAIQHVVAPRPIKALYSNERKIPIEKKVDRDDGCECDALPQVRIGHRSKLAPGYREPGRKQLNHVRIDSSTAGIPIGRGIVLARRLSANQDCRRQLRFQADEALAQHRPRDV